MWSVYGVEKYDVGPPLVLLCVITLAPLPTVDALDMPLEGGWFVISDGRWGPIIGVKFALGGCGRKCCCCCGGMGPKLGETEVPWGMKLGERVAEVAGEERCEPGVGCDSGERLGTAPSGWIMGKPCEPSALGGPCSDRRCCCLFITARC